MNRKILLNNIDKLHTTDLGIKRIRSNLDIDNNVDVVTYLKEKIIREEAYIYKKGKNYYCNIDDISITINSYSYTIITAHKSLEKYAFIFISKKINLNEIYNYLYMNMWISKNKGDILQKISHRELENNYNMKLNNKEVVGILFKDIDSEYDIVNSYKEIYLNEEEDLIIYSIINRDDRDYLYNPYVTSNTGLKYNFYNIEKEYEKLAYKKSFFIHYNKSYQGYLLYSILGSHINNNNIINILLNKDKVDSKYKLELLESVNSIREVVEYIFMINKYKYNNYELIDVDKNDYDINREIDLFVKKIEKDLGKFISFYELNNFLVEDISNFSIPFNIWCLVLEKGILVIDCGSYE